MEIKSTKNYGDADALRKFCLDTKSKIEGFLREVRSLSSCGDTEALEMRLLTILSEAEKLCATGEILAKETERKAKLAAAYSNLQL